MHGKAYAVCALLQDLLGQDKFLAVIRKVIRERAGGLLSGADLLRYCETELGSSLDWFAADWVRGQATLDYAISGARPVGSQWEVSINRLGTAGYPVTVEAVTEKGAKLRQRVVRKASAPTLLFATSDPLKSVVIDPDEVTPDVVRDNNHWPH
jgi:aminopeptidase N